MGVSLDSWGLQELHGHARGDGCARELAYVVHGGGRRRLKRENDYEERGEARNGEKRRGAHPGCNGVDGESSEGVTTTNLPTRSTAAGGLLVKKATSTELLGSIGFTERRSRRRRITWTDQLAGRRSMATSTRWRCSGAASVVARTARRRGGGGPVREEGVRGVLWRGLAQERGMGRPRRARASPWRRRCALPPARCLEGRGGRRQRLGGLGRGQGEVGLACGAR